MRRSATIGEKRELLARWKKEEKAEVFIVSNEKTLDDDDATRENLKEESFIPSAASNINISSSSQELPEKRWEIIFQQY